jgi:hypothetical protein
MCASFASPLQCRGIDIDQAFPECTQKMGSQGVHELNTKYSLGVDLSRLPHYERVPWQKLVTDPVRATPDALDLLDKLLR